MRERKLGHYDLLELRTLARLSQVICWAVLTITLADCDDSSYGLCGHELMASSGSSDDKYIASITIIDCGATTDYASWIAIRPRGTQYKPRAEPVAIFEGRLSQLYWEGTNLVIVHHGERHFKREARWKDVRIIYRQVSN